MLALFRPLLLFFLRAGFSSNLDQVGLSPGRCLLILPVQV